MGGLLCDGSNICKGSLDGDEYVIAYQPRRPASQGVAIPKDFFAKLPRSKVILASKYKAQEVSAMLEQNEKEHAAKYQLPDDFQVPQELLFLHEKGVVLNKTNIRLFIEYFVEDTKGYTNYGNEPHLKVWAKSGTDLADEHVVIKSNYVIEGNYPLSALVDVLCDIKSRPKWDSKTIQTEILHEYCPSLVTYRSVVYMPVISNRDFAEKRIVFQEGDSYYFYYSSVPDEYCPAKAGSTRGYTILAVNRMYKMGDKIVVTTVTQKDVQNSVANWTPLSSIGTRAFESLEVFRREIAKRARDIVVAKGLLSSTQRYLISFT